MLLAAAGAAHAELGINIYGASYHFEREKSEGLRLGLALVLMHSDTYNNGDPFIAPAPVAAYEWRRAGLSMVYFPKFSDVNPTNQVGFWITLRIPE